MLNELENESILVSPMMFIQKYLSGGITYARQTGYICACAIVFGVFVMIFSILERRLMRDRRKKNARSADCLRYRRNKGACAEEGKEDA